MLAWKYIKNPFFIAMKELEKDEATFFQFYVKRGTFHFPMNEWGVTLPKANKRWWNKNTQRLWILNIWFFIIHLKCASYLSLQEQVKTRSFFETPIFVPTQPWKLFFSSTKNFRVTNISCAIKICKNWLVDCQIVIKTMKLSLVLHLLSKRVLIWNNSFIETESLQWICIQTCFVMKKTFFIFGSSNSAWIFGMKKNQPSV